MDDILELAKSIVELASDTLAADIILLDVRDITPFVDYYVLMTGETIPHMNALERHIIREIRSKGYGRPLTEGSLQGEWVLINSGGITVHILKKETRAFYQLEKLWNKAPMLITVQ